MKVNNENNFNNQPDNGSKEMDKKNKFTERRHVVIYGYTRKEMTNIIRHFESQLPDYVKMAIESLNLVTKITLTGVYEGQEILRYKMNQYQQQLSSMFSEEVISESNKTVSQILGELLMERELTISCAESCTGGNLAHRITQQAGSSTYFLGSVVSYSNDVKANVLKVSRSAISRHGAVSREVAEEMAKGVASLMKSDCAISTTGIAGPDGGTKFKPVGTVWMSVKYCNQVVSECIHFTGDRNEVIEKASNHGMVMLIRLLRNNYSAQEEITDD